MAKSLQKRLHLKQKLYSFRMTDDKLITVLIDDFNKILDDLSCIDVAVQDEDQAIMLLNALPKSYEQFKDPIIFGRSAITSEEVKTMVKTKELQKIQDQKEEHQTESLNI